MNESDFFGCDLARIESDAGTRRKFRSRLASGDISISDDACSHIGVYFLPYDAIAKQALLVHHKKSGLWIFPGGHLERGEKPIDTFAREVKEELGAWIEIDRMSVPFLLTISSIDNKGYECREHFDVWYLLEIKKKHVQVDRVETIEDRWVELNKAVELVTDRANIEAIEKVRVLKHI